MAQFQVYGLSELPSTPAKAGSIYYIGNGDHFLGTSNGDYLKISDTVFVDGSLPTVGIIDKLYIQKNGDETKFFLYSGSNYIEIYNSEYLHKKNTFIFFTNSLTIGEISARAKIPYNAKITKLETILTSVSGSNLAYELEKSTDGINFISLNVNENIPTGQALISTDITNDVLVNEGDILRIRLLTQNVEAKGININLSIEEI